MKILILMVSLLGGTLAQASSISVMKKYLPDGVWLGIDTYGGGSNTTCQIAVEWLSDSEVKVTSTTQYKDRAPSISEILFSEAKLAEVYRDELNETDVELSLAQSAVIFEEDDYQVKRMEQVVVELVEGHKLESIGVNLVEYDMESDSHEDITSCGHLTKIK